MKKIWLYCFALALVSLSLPVPSRSSTFNYTYDSLDRLILVETTDGSLVITYTYDSVGNRLSMTVEGSALDAPEVADAGDYTLDNTSVDLNVTTYDEQYGNLTYQYGLGTACGAIDVQGWTTFSPDLDGNVVLVGLNLPYDLLLFVSVRILNFAGDVVSDIGCNDGLLILDPLGDDDEDGYDNQLEVSAGTDPFNPNSYPGLTIINLQPGFNLVAIPEDVTNHPDLNYWMPTLGNSSEIEKVLAYNDQTGKFVTLLPGDPPSGSFILQGGEGLIVYANLNKEVTFTTILCTTYDLKSDFNLIGIACPPEGYTAFQLLTDLGLENAASIQRFSPEKGAFETASFDKDGQLVGFDFEIVPGEGYFIFMKQEVLGFGF